jgi:hypothetical protein
MARIYLRRTLTGFTVADESSQDLARKYKVGEVYRADIVKPRSYQHHKQVMVLLELTYQNLPDRYKELWPTDKKFRRGMADAVGHVEQYCTVDGEVKTIPLSLSYDDLPDEVDFSEIVSLIFGVCAHILGMDQPGLVAEVARHANHGAAA